MPPSGPRDIGRIDPGQGRGAMPTEKITDAELRCLKVEGRHLEAAFKRFVLKSGINYVGLTTGAFDMLRASYMAGADYVLGELDDFLDPSADPVANAMAVELQASELSFHAKEPRWPRVGAPMKHDDTKHKEQVEALIHHLTEQPLSGKPRPAE